ncbi:uncharacterized protein LOC128724913 [Anopheles nili]|uniref:uncharacterized protein LOC128724913 n=1 Tax=Anopheles nili TaxID=185578 RepID=UPI00237AEF37|nr:uncharacterized protein LOC128724913 [Anopheles nili]
MNGLLQPSLAFFKSLGWRGKLLATFGVIVSTDVIYELWLLLRDVVHRKKSQMRFCEVHFMNRRKIANPSPSSLALKFEHTNRLVSYIDRAEKSIYLSMYIFTIKEVCEAVIRAKNERSVTVRVVSCESMVYNEGSQLRNLIDADIIVRYKLNSENLMHHKFCLLDTDWWCANCLMAFHCAQYGEPANMQFSTFDKAVISDKPGLYRLFGSSCTRCDSSKRKLSTRQRSGSNPLPKGGILITGSSNWTMAALSLHWDNMILTSFPEMVNPFSVEFQRIWYEMNDILVSSQLPVPTYKKDDAK